MSTGLAVPSTDAVQLAVHDLGGDGPDVLLAHATGFHALVWRQLARHLDGYHRWAPDLRGHGDASPPASGTFDWNGFADDVLAVIDALGLERPFGVGHSKGGAALLLAEQRRPGSFRALYVYEPVVFPPGRGMPDDNNPLAEGAARRRDVFDSYDAAYDNFASKPPFDVLDPAALRDYVDHGFALQDDHTVRLKCRPAHEAQVYRMGGRHGAFAHLAEVICPVTVARGAATDGPGMFAPRIASALPDGRLEEFPELGHFGPLERPDIVGTAARKFFDGIKN